MNTERLASRIVKKQIQKPWLFIIVFAIITLLLLPGIFRLVNNVEPSLEKVLPGDIKELQLMNEMRSQFGADMMYLIVYADGPVEDVRNPDLVRYIDMISQKIEKRSTILNTYTIADSIKYYNGGVIPQSKNKIEDVVRNHPEMMQYIEQNYQFTVIRITSDTGANAELIEQTVDGIKEDIASLEAHNPGTEIKLTGYNAIDKATFEIIIADFIKITAVSMILVLGVVLLTFRSFYKGILPLTVVMVAILWTMGIAGYLNLTITVVSMVAAAMIMGLGIDFGIHVTHSYFELRKKKSIQLSMTETMKELFLAMVGASLTTIAGFLALLFGVLPAMKVLGIILAIGIFSTLIGAVFLLPVLVLIYDKHINSRGEQK